MTTSRGVISSPNYGAEQAQQAELARNNAYYNMLNQQLGLQPGDPWLNPEEKEGLLDAARQQQGIYEALQRNLPYAAEGQEATMQETAYRQALPSINKMMDIFRPGYLGSRQAYERQKPGATNLGAWYDQWMPRNILKSLDPWRKMGGLINPGPNWYDIWNPNPNPPSSLPWT